MTRIRISDKGGFREEEQGRRYSIKTVCSWGVGRTDG